MRADYVDEEAEKDIDRTLREVDDNASLVGGEILAEAPEDSQLLAYRDTREPPAVERLAQERESL